jgi:hypothetical protein
MVLTLLPSLLPAAALHFTPQRHIGRFRDALDAAKAYDRAAYYLYGEKAILNFSMEEAAADQGSVPLFIRQAKEQAEAAAALAEAMGAAADGSASSSGIVSTLHTQGDAAAAAAAAALTAGMQAQTGWQQILTQQPQQQQQQVYILDAYGNIVCQSAASTTSSLQQLQQQQQVDAYGNPTACQPIFLHPHAMQQQALQQLQQQQQQLDACGNLLTYQPVALHSPCSMQQQQLTSSPLQLSTAWSSPGNLAHAELAAVPPGLLLGNYSVSNSNSSMMYGAPADACVPISSCADAAAAARLYSSGGSTCSSQSVAMTTAMLHHSLTPVSLSTACGMHGSSAMTLLPQASTTAAGCGSMQQMTAPGDVHMGDRMMLRQTLEWQLQKQQSLPKPGQRVQGLTTSPQAHVQPGAYVNSSSTALPQATPAALGMSLGMAPQQQQQSPAPAASSSSSSNVQVLHMPAMPMPTVQEPLRPAVLQAQKAAQQHLLLPPAHAQAATSTAATSAYGASCMLVQASASQQQLPYGCNVVPAQHQAYGAVHCAPQQHQGMPVSVDVLTGMIKAGALQL